VGLEVWVTTVYRKITVGLEYGSLLYIEKSQWA
jgi:hypothetical protein